MESTCNWTTGSRRGYVPVKLRDVESELLPIPEDVKGLRGNFRWAMLFFARQGATHYTVKSRQGVPGRGYSNSYCYSVYKGYK